MEIEKNIAIPTTGKKLIFEALESGDSIFFENEVKFKSFRSELHPWLKRNNPTLKIVGRKLDTGFRLWVISK